MMAEAEEHYARLLAEHYTWMSCGGDYEAKIAENCGFFASKGFGNPRLGGRVLDLGCGSGFQSLALAQLGFKVLGIDSSPTLLDELRARGNAQDVTTVQGDMRDRRLYEARGPFEVAVCMGDSLVHLRSVEEVAQLIRDVRQSLEKDGWLILGFRDLTAELRGIDRVIPVRSDDGRIMATFLEYTETHVQVHDMLFVREGVEWKMLKSAYPKLRIGAEQVLEMLKATGFKNLQHEQARGFSTILSQAA
jgi:SAM-dependent methyltransferase